MVELKADFLKGLNSDDSYYQLPPGSYVDANNITRDAISTNADNIFTNIIGNRSIDYTFPAGTNKSIGAIANTLRGTVISFVYNSNSYHSIVEYNISSRTASKVLENLTDTDGVDILGFTENEKITGVNIFNRDEGDFLFFLDSEGRPTFLNITLFKAGTYTPVSRQIIDVAKIPPAIPPTCIYGNDATRTSNYLQKKLFRFQYRWVYDDNFKSTFSPISAIPLPENILDQDYTNVLTNNNFITVSIDSGDKNVKGVEIAVSVQNGQNLFNNLQLVEYIDKTADSIDDNITFTYTFYNDSTYPVIDTREADLLFDYVPRQAISQEMPNGNSLCYGAITEGYDRTLDPNIEVVVDTTAAGGGINTGSLNGNIFFLDQDVNEWKWQIIFSGVPPVGMIVNVYAQRTSDGMNILIGNYTTVAGDNALSVATGIYNSMIAIGITDDETLTASINSVDYEFPKSIYNNLSTLELIPPTSAASSNSISTWGFWEQLNIGIQYYDEQGRTNGILYSLPITFPGYAENGSQEVLLPYLNVKIYHIPPEWAYTYQLLFTKDLTQFLYIQCVDVVTTESSHLYFDITNLLLNQRKNPTTAQVVSWTFQDGDRIRLIKRVSDGTVYGTDYDSSVDGIVVAPTIQNVTQVDKVFIKIPRSAPFSSIDFSSKYFIIQLYRPTLQEPNNENATYYESAIEYAILNPETEYRVHAGQVTNQSTDYVTPAEINIYNGDAYFRGRIEYLSETGLGLFYVQDRNFVDFFISAVNDIDGRPSLIDINAKETYFPSLIRYSQFYQPNTNINGLNRFYPDAFLECDYSYGDIFRMKVRDRFMRIFQTLKVGMIPIFNKMGKTSTGDEITIVTNELLNPVQYYSGDYGIGTNKECLASFNYADYYVSNITGGIYRVSLNGNEVLSVLYKMNSWAIDNIPLRTGAYKIYGAYDQRLNNYVIALEAAVVPNTLIAANQQKVKALPPYFLFTLEGIPVADEEVSVYLIDGNGVERTYTYIVVSGNSNQDVSNGLKALINADVYFVASDQTTYPDPGLKITQVATVNAALFNGNVTIVYPGNVTSAAQTIIFSEEDNTFDSFVSYKPEMMVSIGTILCSFKNGVFYTHDNPAYNTFYGEEFDSDLTVIFSAPPAARKQPMSLTYAANSKWDCPVIQTQVNSYGTTKQQSDLKNEEFKLQEGMYVASFKRDANSQGGKINGNPLKGNWVSVKFRNTEATQLITLETIICKFNESYLNPK